MFQVGWCGVLSERNNNKSHTYILVWLLVLNAVCVFLVCFVKYILEVKYYIQNCKIADNQYYPNRSASLVTQNNLEKSLICMVFVHMFRLRFTQLLKSASRRGSGPGSAPTISRVNKFTPKHYRSINLGKGFQMRMMIMIGRAPWR